MLVEPMLVRQCDGATVRVRYLMRQCGASSTRSDVGAGACRFRRVVQGIDLPGALPFATPFPSINLHLFCNKGPDYMVPRVLDALLVDG